MINKDAYQTNRFLARALKKLRKNKFEQMIVFLAWENLDRTSNHVERNNRVFRMLQKRRYKRRQDHTIQKAIELDMNARMLRHPLYEANFTERHGPPQEEVILKMAA